MSIKLIIGLRNPGSVYSKTRHNAGAWFVESVVARFGDSFKVDSKLSGELAEFTIENTRCKAFLPLSFMNHCGLSVKKVSAFYRIPVDEVLVVHDDLDLPTGRIKLKTGGGHGGHNGLRDIVAHLGQADFHRLRIGIGHPQYKDQVVNYVVGIPSVVERRLIVDAIERGIATMPLILSNMATAMTKLHS